MSAPRVWVFFYGSYMNLDVLAGVGLAPANLTAATLAGFDIRIAPRANLLRDESAHVHGILATLSHGELDRLYAHAQDVLGELYLPEAVHARTSAGAFVPALCYVCHDMQPRPAERAYVDRIVAAARAHGFPAAYVERLVRVAAR
jgi:hypothetical protein